MEYPLLISPYGKVRYEPRDCGYETECWVWKLGNNGKYPLLRGGCYAHRYFYKELIGEIPKGYDVHHKCENTMCVNYEHLGIKTRKEHIDIHLTGKSQSKDLIEKRSKALIGNTNSIGSKPCKSGCTCERHERGWIKRIGKSFRSKLDFDKADRIRELCNEGYTRKEVAFDFNVTVNTICEIVNNKMWVR
jgi:hypothetical protein